jgi:hypothetical protein
MSIRRPRWTLVPRVILAAITVFALLSSLSIGAFVAPALVPILWLAAKDASNGWTRGLWIAGASMCAWLAGFLIGLSLRGQLTDGWTDFGIPLVTTTVVCVLYIATTEPHGRDGLPG